MRAWLESINWALIRRELWNKGPILIFMGPTAIPIGVWFYMTMLPKDVRTGYPELDLLAIMAAILAGFAIDLGVVRIATGKPTHENRWYSLTTWVPIIVWLMGCIILWDWYFTIERGVFSTIAHLAFPTISLVMALYWAFEKGYEDTIASPLRAEIESLAIQLEAWNDRFKLRVDEATQGLTQKISQLTAETQREKERADTINERFNEAQSIYEQAGNAHAEVVAELRIIHQQAIASLQEKAAQQYRIDHELIDRLTVEVERLKGQGQEPGVYQYPTMADAIRAHLLNDPLISNGQLIAALRIPDDQLNTFRSQVSQVKKALGSALTA